VPAFRASTRAASESMENSLIYLFAGEFSSPNAGTSSITYRDAAVRTIATRMPVYVRGFIVPRLIFPASALSIDRPSSGQLRLQHLLPLR